MKKRIERPEQLTIRPPNEWRSMLIRVTCGCKWNRCKFCGIYPALGVPEFSIRSIDDIKRDIDWYEEHLPGLDTAFLGDSDPLCRKFEESIEILQYLREKHPYIKRVTAYARSSTIFKLGFEKLKLLKKAGLDRIHTGLESGNLEILKFHCKGHSPKILMQSGNWAKNAGIQLSYYVLLGLGGINKWKVHIDDTAEIINNVNPDFIRIRRLWIYRGDRGLPNLESPLCEEIRKGNFIPQTPHGTVLELYRLIDRLNCQNCKLLCDHANNYIRVDGKLPEDKSQMLAQINNFLSLPEKTRSEYYESIGSEI